VLYFEGERHLSYRILRAVKNRFGSTNEIGIFEMRMWGLWKWKIRHQCFCRKERKAFRFCGGSNFGRHKAHADRNSGTGLSHKFRDARRMATGLDYNRITLLMAVLEKRVGMQLHNYDAYVNVVEDLRLMNLHATLVW